MMDEQAFARFLARQAACFSTCGEGTQVIPATMGDLVSTWIAYWTTKSRVAKDEWSWASRCVDYLIENDANLGLEFVLAVLAKNPDRKVLAVLAAGSLEDLLVDHGPAIIARIEEEARQSPQFRELLGGVWQNAMPEEIWQRVLRAAPNRW